MPDREKLLSLLWQREQLLSDSLHIDLSDPLHLMPENEELAFFSVDERLALSFVNLKYFLLKFSTVLAKYGLQAGMRVASVMPNDAGCATLFLAAVRLLSFAPLNPSLTLEELAFELTDYKCQAIICGKGADNYDSLCDLAAKLHIGVIAVVPDASTTGIFQMNTESHQVPSAHGPTVSHAEALVLHTSGTTSKPKTISLTKSNFLSGAICVLSTLQVAPDWTCVNIMPLFHIHGLVANLLVSVLAGCKLLCLPRADSETWFTYLSMTDYYSAVPTLHLMILSKGRSLREANSLPQNQLKIVRNCSAALLHPVARELAAMFQTAKVLPTYAMSESFPICSPSRDYELNKPNSVGPAAGGYVDVCNETGQTVAIGEEAEVCVAGAHVISAYHNDERTNVTSFHGQWLRTGDQGHVDHDGWLFLTGRFKEIINRAGEKISPFAVEEAALGHSSVYSCLAFGFPDSLFGEDIGLMVVLKANASVFSLASVRQHLALQGLAHFKMPNLLVFTDALPLGPTRKPLRIGLAAKLGLDFSCPIIRKFVPRELELQDDGTVGLARITTGHHGEAAISASHRETIPESQRSRTWSLRNYLARHGLQIRDDSQTLQDLGVDSLSMYALITVLKEQHNGRHDLEALIASQPSICALEKHLTALAGSTQACILDTKPLMGLRVFAMLSIVAVHLSYVSCEHFLGSAEPWGLHWFVVTSAVSTNLFSLSSPMRILRQQYPRLFVIHALCWCLETPLFFLPQVTTTGLSILPRFVLPLLLLRGFFPFLPDGQMSHGWYMSLHLLTSVLAKPVFYFFRMQEWKELTPRICVLLILFTIFDPILRLHVPDFGISNLPALRVLWNNFHDFAPAYVFGIFQGYAVGRLLSTECGALLSPRYVGLLADGTLASAILLHTFVGTSHGISWQENHLVSLLIPFLAFFLCRSEGQISRLVLCSKPVQKLVPYTLAVYLVHYPLMIWVSALHHFRLDLFTMGPSRSIFTYWRDQTGPYEDLFNNHRWVYSPCAIRSYFEYINIWVVIMVGAFLVEKIANTTLCATESLCSRCAPFFWKSQVRLL